VSEDLVLKYTAWIPRFPDPTHSKPVGWEISDSQLIPK